MRNVVSGGVEQGARYHIGPRAQLWIAARVQFHDPLLPLGIFDLESGGPSASLSMLDRPGFGGQEDRVGPLPHLCQRHRERVVTVGEPRGIRHLVERVDVHRFPFRVGAKDSRTPQELVGDVEDMGDRIDEPLVEPASPVAGLPIGGLYDRKAIVVHPGGVVDGCCRRMPSDQWGAENHRGEQAQHAEERTGRSH